MDSQNKSLVFYSAIVTITIASLGLFSYIPGFGLWGSLGPDFIPMAPTTAISFILLAVSSLLIKSKSSNKTASAFVLLCVALVALFGLLEVIGHFVNKDISLEEAFVPSVGELHGVPIARMSPSTGLFFFISGTTLLLMFAVPPQRKRNFLVSCSGFLSVVVCASSLTFLLGYLYGTPLLYGQHIIPMALTTALGFFFLSLILLASLPTNSFPVNLLYGASTRAKLMRVFLPVSLLAVLIQGSASSLLDPSIEINDALLSVIIALLVSIITTIAVSKVAKFMGGRIDGIEQDLRKAKVAVAGSEKKYRSMVEQSLLGVCVIQEEKLKYVNHRFCEIFGYSEKELLERITLPELIIMEDWGLVKIETQQSSSGERNSRNYTVRGKHKNGSVIWIEIYGSKVEFEGKTALSGELLDITERVLATEKNKEQSILLENMSRTGKVGGWELNVLTGKLTWTKETARIQDLDPDAEINLEKGLDQYQGEARKKIESILGLTLKQGTPYDLEVEIFTTKGNHKWVRIIGHPEKHGEKVVRIRGILQDITSLKQREVELRKSEERNRLILQTAMDGFWRTDMQNRLLEVNNTYCQMSGYTEPELLGMSVSDLEAIETPGEIDAHFQKLIAQGEDRFESRYRRKDGSIFDVEISGQYRPDDGGQMIFFLRDITERKRAEEELQESEERFRSVFDQAAVGVARLAPDGTWLEVNNKLCDIVGYSRDEFLSKTFQDITHPDDLQVDLDYVKQLLKDEIKTYTMEKRYLKKNGDTVWINLTASLTRDTNNDADSFIAVIEDITKRKQTEKELEKSREHLESLVDERTSELRTKIEELELFNTFAVDREEQMISLKEEINSLLSELEREEKYTVVK